MAVACAPDVRQKSAMEERAPVSSRSALRRAGVGEIVEVQGGHIVRATGRKDRHSKVCTAKGPRDRRVRLAAHTAIQFYDVQDRLGYDRPSKAVDWLIKNAKSAIDELDQLPAWTPTSVTVSAAGRRKGKASGGGKVVESAEKGLYGDSCGASLLPPSLNSDAIADTIKSFFPVGGGTSLAATRPEMQFEGYTHGVVGGGDGIRQREDLNLSLQSFQAHDPILMHSQHGTNSAHHDEQQHSVFAGAVPIGYENPNVGWVDSQHQPSPESGRLHRLLLGWQNQQHNTSIDQHHYNNGGHAGGDGVSLNTAGGGFMFNQPSLLQPLFGSHHGQYFTQRGPLQSSNSPLLRAWFSDPSIATSSEQHLQAIPVHPQGFSSLVYPSGGFSGFHIPARIQGEEEHDGDLNPSSASSGSRH